MEYQSAKEEIWSSLGRATVDRKHPWRFPVLASAHGKQVEQRTVVLRAYDPQKHQLVFYTDFRSPKVQQFLANPQASLLFYHPRQQWQVRVRGQIEIHHQDDLAQSHLAKIPDERRGDYQSAQAPGKPLKKGLEGLPAQDNFCLLIFQAQAMDSLKLGGEEHQRFSLDLLQKEVRPLQP